MNQQRDLDRIHTDSTAAPDHDGIAPGRGSTSGQLAAPANPISGAWIQRKARDGNGVAAGAESAVAAASSSSGAALPGALMNRFESSLGADLSGVRVHTGAASAASADAVGARAYTVGNDIHFGAGQYDPSSAGGQHLLAHEVAHTVQQSGGAQRTQFKLAVSSPGDSFEHEADRAADAMVAGAKASVSGVSGQPVSRLFSAYSDDDDIKKLPPPPKYTGTDDSFAAMAQAIAASVKGEAASVASPASGLGGSISNLIACRDHGESENVYYTTHAPSKWNPFGDQSMSVLAASAKADANWAITMLANVRVASSATGSWVTLANASNHAWVDLARRADSMSISVGNPMEQNPLAKLDGRDHAKPGDQKIDTIEFAASGADLGRAAAKAGVKAPDTNAYKKAMQEYSQARNELAPQQQNIITTLIPTNIVAIKAKLKTSTDEKEKWETVSSATDMFEKGLTVAFGGAALEEVGTLGMTPEGELAAPKGIDAKDAVSKGHGYLSKVFQMRIAAIQKHIDSYNSNLKTYTDVQEAMSLKAAVGEYKNGLVKLRDKANTVAAERDRMEAAFLEFGKSLDAAGAKQGGAKGSDDNQQAAALLIALRTASTTTQGAIDGLSSGGVADLPELYGELARLAGTRQEDQTASAGGLKGRSDARAAVFGIERGRWGHANSAVTAIAAALGRRHAQIATLEAEFYGQFSKASGGTDSIK